MTQVEAMGYMSAEVYQIFKQVIVPTLLAKAVTKSWKEDVYNYIEALILGVLNHSEIKCHVCHEYFGWWSVSMQHEIVQKNKNEKEVK